MDDSEQRAHIVELLIEPWWPGEGDAIIQSALDAGMPLDVIAATITNFGIEMLILNSLFIKTYPEGVWLQGV